MRQRTVIRPTSFNCALLHNLTKTIWLLYPPARNRPVPCFWNPAISCGLKHTTKNTLYKRLAIFLSPAWHREFGSDIPAGDRKIAKLFFQCTVATAVSCAVSTTPAILFAGVIEYDVAKIHEIFIAPRKNGTSIHYSTVQISQRLRVYSP
jgi:hypothetical protein